MKINKKVKKKKKKKKKIMATFIVNLFVMLYKCVSNCRMIYKNEPKFQTFSFSKTEEEENEQLRDIEKVFPPSNTTEVAKQSIAATCLVDRHFPALLIVVFC